MPAISADWQARIVERDFVLGAGTNYPGVGAISGLGLLPPSLNDVTRFGDGDAFGRDRLPVRILSLPVKVLGDTSADVWTNYRALAVAWRRAATELALDLRIPGSAETVMRYFGRPMELPADLHGLKGVQETVADFRAEPYAYGAQVVSAVDTASPLVIAAGDLGDDGADSDRAVLTLVGSGGTPVLTNTTTGGVITFASALSGTAVVDLHAQTMAVDGAPADGAITADSSWFTLAGGQANTLTWTGATSLAVTHRPAYQVI